jgi:hypothetical protein
MNEQSRPPVWASLATIPSRADALKQTLCSLLPQVDKISVMLNGFSDTSGLLHDPRIQYIECVGQEDRGDAGKFRVVAGGSSHGYYFVCDDDLLFPEDYVSTMIGHIERFDRRAVVGLHGIRLRTHPVSSYRRGRDVRHCLYPAEVYRTEHLLGTSSIAFHGSVLFGPYGHRFGMPLFKSNNMADIWFALWAQAHAIPLVSVPREKDWLKLLVPPEDDSIWNRMLRDGDAEQVAAINSRTWALHEPEAGG